DALAARQIEDRLPERIVGDRDAGVLETDAHLERTAADLWVDGGTGALGGGRRVDDGERARRIERVREQRRPGDRATRRARERDVELLIGELVLVAADEMQRRHLDDAAAEFAEHAAEGDDLLARGDAARH